MPVPHFNTVLRNAGEHFCDRASESKLNISIPPAQRHQLRGRLAPTGTSLLHGVFADFGVHLFVAGVSVGLRTGTDHG
jgi:hypothetical protein